MKEGPAHFLAWVPRARGQGPTRHRGKERLAERALKPTHHATKQRHLEERVRPGDTIWLAGSHPRFGLTAPSLDGCIRVASKSHSAEGLCFLASEESFWLPWADASTLLATLEFRSAAGASAKLLPDRPIGPQLQTTRTVAPESVATLEQHARMLLSRPRLFISYRWAVEPRTMGRVVATAAECGFAAWWDQWSAPRRLVSGIDRDCSEEELEELLSEGLAGSAAALVVKSAGYGDTRWTRFELARILAAGVPVIEMDPRAPGEPSGIEALKRRLRRVARSLASGPAQPIERGG